MLTRVLRDPILHFLLAGLALFLLARVFSSQDAQRDDESSIIRIDRATLLTYMQYQANAFDGASFARALDNMGSSELQQLIDDYVTEEVLYREAAALGLEKSDYLIRQRMVDKMRFLLADLASTEAAPTAAELQGWFEQNRAQYRIAASASFTHVFIDASSVGQTQARARAEALLAQLNSSQVGFSEAAGHGDRFPFLRNYVERTLDFTGGHFGQQFAAALQQLQPAAGLWQGPLQSDYGYHLVMLTALTPASDPALEEVAANVARDFGASRSEAQLQQMVQDVREQYDVDASAVFAGQD